MWYLNLKIANPCIKNEEGKRPRTKIDGKWVCDLGKENPDSSRRLHIS